MSSYAFIEAEKERYPVSWLCRVAQVSRAAYYNNRKRTPSQRSQEDDRRAALMRAHHEACDGTLGARGHVASLAAEGIRCSRRRARRLMLREGLRSCHARRFVARAITTPIAVPDRVKRHFYAEAPNRLWVGDITYIWTRHGWAYLALLTDVFSRRIVGWAVDSHMRRELVQEALEMALASRRPEPGLIHHTDRGMQYRAADYAAILRGQGHLQSAGQTGVCWDNALAESMNATLKKEVVHRHSWVGVLDLRAVLRTKIPFYNEQRRHSSLGYLTPAEFEDAHAA